MTAPAPNEHYDWTGAAERLRQAADVATEAPPAWMPEPGDELVGVVVEIAPAVHTRHGPVPVVTLQGPNGGRRCVWLIHTVLRRGFIRANVQVGEVVLVRYVGKVDREAGDPWHDYCVVVDRSSSSSSPDWAAIAKRHKDEAALEDDRTPAPPDEPAAPAEPPSAPLGKDARCVAGDHDFDETLPPDERECRRCGEKDIPF